MQRDLSTPRLAYAVGGEEAKCARCWHLGQTMSRRWLDSVQHTQHRHRASYICGHIKLYVPGATHHQPANFPMCCCGAIQQVDLRTGLQFMTWAVRNNFLVRGTGLQKDFAERSWHQSRLKLQAFALQGFVTPESHSVHTMPAVPSPPRPPSLPLCPLPPRVPRPRQAKVSEAG